MDRNIKKMGWAMRTALIRTLGKVAEYIIKEPPGLRTAERHWSLRLLCSLGIHSRQKVQDTLGPVGVEGFFLFRCFNVYKVGDIIS